MNWESPEIRVTAWLALLLLTPLTPPADAAARTPECREATGAVVVTEETASADTGLNGTPVFDRLKKIFEEGHIFSADFSHRYEDSYTGEESHTEGKIWIGKGMYRVESEEQIMVVDGEISRVYNGIRNRLLISSYEEEEDDFAPSRMLQGVDESYTVYEQSQSTHTLVILETDDPFSVFYSIEIRIDGEGIPTEIVATDQADNTLVTSFRCGQFGPEDPGLFEIDIPEDAERVDLRH